MASTCTSFEIGDAQGRPFPGDPGNPAAGHAGSCLGPGGPAAAALARFVHRRPDDLLRPGQAACATSWSIPGWTATTPKRRGREFAEHILHDNFDMALRRENGRLLIDAWMSLNEAVPGPASAQYRQSPGEIEQRLRAYDAFQVGFRNKLMEQGRRGGGLQLRRRQLRHGRSLRALLPAHAGHLHLPGLSRVWLAGVVHRQWTPPPRPAPAATAPSSRS